MFAYVAKKQIGGPFCSDKHDLSMSTPDHPAKLLDGLGLKLGGGGGI